MKIITENSLATILIIYLLAFLVGFIWRSLVKAFARRAVYKKHKNIGSYDRFYRLLLGVILLVVAMTTDWNPVLIFASGFCIFESMFSWCAFYAAIGKNTCPIE
jgi:hypothetical protein